MAMSVVVTFLMTRIFGIFLSAPPFWAEFKCWLACLTVKAHIQVTCNVAELSIFVGCNLDSKRAALFSLSSCKKKKLGAVHGSYWSWLWWERSFSLGIIFTAAWQKYCLHSRKQERACEYEFMLAYFCKMAYFERAINGCEQIFCTRQ